MPTCDWIMATACEKCIPVEGNGRNSIDYNIFLSQSEMKRNYNNLRKGEDANIGAAALIRMHMVGSQSLSISRTRITCSTDITSRCPSGQSMINPSAQFLVSLSTWWPLAISAEDNNLIKVTALALVTFP